MKPNILFYDIETSYLMSRHWRLGDQVLRHNQLVAPFDMYQIICIAYCFNDDKPAKVIGWGLKDQSTANVVKKFTEIYKKADIAIGKNNKSFDKKHIQAQRFINQLEPLPTWAMVEDDVQQQFKRHFSFPSQSLDYLSSIFGLGGKDKMEMEDWVNVVERHNAKAYKKMMLYCCKDVEDTRALYNKALPYMTPLLNCSRYFGNITNNYEICRSCGSDNLLRNGIDNRGATPRQRWKCVDCGHEGRSNVKPNSKMD